MKGNIQDWIDRAGRLEAEAKAARIEADSRPSISVADLVTWKGRLIYHGDDLYEVTVKKLEPIR